MAKLYCFHTSTQLTIANAIRTTNIATTQAIHYTEIYVDGLSKANRRKWGAALKRHSISGHTVHSVAKDENHPLIRLADTVAGFVRDTVEIGTNEFCVLMDQGKDRGVLIEI